MRSRVATHPLTPPRTNLTHPTTPSNPHGRPLMFLGEFIMEYVGEVVSQEEGERRGRIADKNNLSYMFRLNDDRFAHRT